MNELIEELINELPSQVACANAREDFASELERVFLGSSKGNLTLTKIYLVFVAISAILIIGQSYLI